MGQRCPPWLPGESLSAQWTIASPLFILLPGRAPFRACIKIHAYHRCFLHPPQLLCQLTRNTVSDTHLFSSHKRQALGTQADTHSHSPISSSPTLVSTTRLGHHIITYSSLCNAIFHHHCSNVFPHALLRASHSSPPPHSRPSGARPSLTREASRHQ
ncbi:hypothetical protein FA95DRAFT_69023 [Auriscalpium vulgare]|uniref:Uncharacterized protein n=1 Tax=Auriscalpium vulgare TaxID=40419 RepID=A0ACB8S8E7_9AGAM|nr:hypothetical protein FA95DRAFT_69023 [Auriscalpium vulgare]